MKAFVFRLHRYIGLVAAAFLFVQAITGTMLVFGPQVAQLLDPAGMTSGPGSTDPTPARLVAAAAARYPDAGFGRVAYPSQDDGTYLVHLVAADGTQRFVSLDRHSGAVLRSGGILRFPVIAALNLHDRWLTGRLGTAIVSLAGLSLLILAGTGLASWWPRRGALRKSLTVRWTMAPRLVLRQLHRTVGVSLSALLAFVAVTGLFVAVPMLLDPPPATHATAAEAASGMDSAVAFAGKAFPGRTIRDIRQPAPGRLAVFLFAPERNSMAVNRVVVDTVAGKVESTRAASADRAAWVIALPLHSGRTFGLPGRILVLLVGLSLAALAVTGPLMWLHARRTRRRSPASLPARGLA